MRAPHAPRFKLPILREVAQGRTVRAACIGLCGVFVAATTSADPVVVHGSRLASKKETTSAQHLASTSNDPLPLLATLALVHTGERVVLDAVNPSVDRFSALLADRVTGDGRPLDPRLCDLLRAIAKAYPAARIEIVSGYRSPKLNEMLRKKGHHVASHSQHSLGNAVDFRVVPAEMATRRPSDDDLPVGVDPREMEREIRTLGWTGGVGVYTLERDWFVHADVGPNRRWWGT